MSEKQREYVPCRTYSNGWIYAQCRFRWQDGICEKCGYQLGSKEKFDGVRLAPQTLT